MIIRWASDGSFNHSFGQPGDGPGELGSQMSLELYRGPGGSVYVNDKRRITIFDQTLRISGLINAPSIGWDGQAMIVTDDGGFVFGGVGERTGSGHWFHRYNNEGTLLRSFGAMDSLAYAGDMPSRTLAYGGGNTFWAAPPPESPNGYLLEEWTLEGELVRVIRRNAYWLGAPDRMDRIPAPMYRVHVDASGLLWVLVLVKSPGAPTLTRDQRPPPGYFEDAAELRLDVIDPESATVLASGVFVDHMGCAREDCIIPARFLALTNEAVTYLESGGFVDGQIYRWHLVRR
jgi:hypothetical protein